MRVSAKKSNFEKDLARQGLTQEEIDRWIKKWRKRMEKFLRSWGCSEARITKVIAYLEENPIDLEDSLGS